MVKLSHCLDRVLQSKIEESDSLLSSLKKSLAEKEEKFAEETLKLKRALEEEEFNKVMSKRNLTVDASRYQIC